MKQWTKELNILYVEDDAMSREQLEDILKLFFRSVAIAFDGEDGLEKYQLQDYDIVITDINMPRLNGLNLIKKIKEINPLQSIIITSAHNNSEYLMQAIELGVDGFIIKPIQMEQFNMVFTKVAKNIHANKLAAHYNEELKQKVEEKTAKLAKQYVSDELTGLLNKNAFINKYEPRTDVDYLLMLIGLDNFDSLLITYGYDNFDYIIQAIAQILQKAVPQECELYRLEQHTFAIISKHYSLEQMHEFAKKIQTEIAMYAIVFEKLSTRVSVSIALVQTDKGLLKKSYMTLQEAQKIGKNRIHFYSKNSPTEILQHKIKTVMPKLKKSIEAKSVVPFFQAIINNTTHTTEKYECLARIIDETNTIQSPADFLDVAELTGMLPDITRIMIDKSFQAFQDNRYQFSINISEYDLNDGYLRTYLFDKCKEYEINSSRVVLEVLEGVSVIGAKNALEQLMELKEDGFIIAIDDFGVQNSNFERVHAMNVDYIKIDGSFIKDIDKDTKSYNVVKMINEFGKSIDAKIIAEYVHSKEVQEIVTALGIEYSQGYYFAKPSQELH